jgi:hypothetical protein
MRKMRLYKNSEVLKKLYLDEKLSLKQIVRKLNVPYSTLHYWMKKNKIPRRKFKTVRISKKKLINLYLNKKLNTREISELYKCNEETVRKKLINFGIPRRSNSESKTKHPKKNFSENLNEKAYMIGFRIGDLSVRRNHALVNVRGTSTHRSFAQLVKNVFGKYGHIVVRIRNYKGLNNFYISCDLNKSFEFLLTKFDKIPEWILDNQECFYSFLAGYSDAEGSWGISRAGKNTKAIRFKFYIGSCDKIILEQIKNKLNNDGLKALLYLGYKKGTKLNYGKLSKDFYHLIVTEKNSVIILTRKLQFYSQHSEKIRKIKLILNSINKEWDEVKDDIFKLRKQIHSERLGFYDSQIIYSKEREQEH